ncbi:DUF4184 family protein [Mucilaginibacter flavus]|uniref:DUF4184 family protein n=1 Tax=Mucilaginibacter flavus TaxID=931504 RepID=UPI0025B2E95A|nr:DUF4184 family protein [Mucilaginibacter flavus]MDN3579743.1 DUF4184 family protein [Mucilaginibacter flavus]
MPFTFSHPAIILPLGKLPKQWFSMTCLVIGSMVPDFEYFLRLRVESIYSHTWLGLIWFDIPLGLLLAFLYQAFIKNNLIENLPAVLNRRFSTFRGTYKDGTLFQYFTVAVISISIGAVSHLVWDSFTHPHGYFVTVIPALSYVVSFGGHQLYVFKIIQHSSTIIGAIIIIAFIASLPQGQLKRQRNIMWFWMQVAFVSVVVVSIRLIAGLSWHRYGDILVTAIAGGLLGLLFASLTVYWKTGNKPFDI